MPAVAIGRISIPKGWDYDVGVSFEKESKPIQVKSVKKNGPMWGKLRRGYMIHGIVLGDNRKVEGLNGAQLKSLLENTSKSKDRKLLVQVAFPSELELKFGPNYDYQHEGVTLEETGGKIMLKKIHDETLRKQILPGMQLASVFFEDVGVEVSGYSLAELAPCFTAETNCRMTLWDPRRAAPSSGKKTILPRRLDLQLPAGVADLGLQVTATVIDGEKQLKLSGMMGSTPCFLGGQGKLLSGMIVQTLLVDSYVFRDLKTASGLKETLEKTSGRPDRIMMLERPTDGRNNKPATKIINGKLSSSSAPTQKKDVATKQIVLPSSNANLGFEFEGTQTGVIQITSVSASSKARVGQTIVGFIDKDGTEYSDIADYDLREMIELSQNTRNRKLVVKEAQWEDNVLSTTAEQEQES